MAIFGNRLVPVGGTIGGWTLTKVEPYGVFLRKGKETRVMELYRQQEPPQSPASGEREVGR